MSKDASSPLHMDDPTLEATDQPSVSDQVTSRLQSMAVEITNIGEIGPRFFGFQPYRKRKQIRRIQL